MADRLPAKLANESASGIYRFSWTSADGSRMEVQWDEGMANPLMFRRPRRDVAREITQPERFGWKTPVTTADFKRFAQAVADEFEAGYDDDELEELHTGREGAKPLGDTLPAQAPVAPAKASASAPMMGDDYDRYPAGSPEHRAARKHHFEATERIGDAHPGDVEASYVAGNAAGLANERWQEQMEAEGDRLDQARRFATQLGLDDGEALYRAAGAVWSSLSPQSVSFDHALSVAGAALQAAAPPAPPQEPAGAPGPGSRLLTYTYSFPVTVPEGVEAGYVATELAYAMDIADEHWVIGPLTLEAVSPAQGTANSPDNSPENAKGAASPRAGRSIDYPDHWAPGTTTRSATPARAVGQPGLPKTRRTP